MCGNEQHSQLFSPPAYKPGGNCPFRPEHSCQNGAKPVRKGGLFPPGMSETGGFSSGVVNASLSSGVNSENSSWHKTHLRFNSGIRSRKAKPNSETGSGNPRTGPVWEHITDINAHNPHEEQGSLCASWTGTSDAGRRDHSAQHACYKGKQWDITLVLSNLSVLYP